jgi:VWFA-related protein
MKRSLERLALALAGALVCVHGMHAQETFPEAAPPDPPPAAQATSPDETRPTFRGEVELVTVDVVITDKKGAPVTGLTIGDFTIEEEGEPQAISSFEAVALPSAPSEAPPARPRVSTNRVPRRQSVRSFVILFDDVHLTPYNAQPAKAAVAAFLENGVREGDRVSLLATSGEAWWSTRMEAGRRDLIEIVKRLEGRRIPDTRLDRMTDWEAMRIYQFQDDLVAARVWRRFEALGMGWESAIGGARAEQGRQDRNMMNEIYSPGVNRLELESRAAEHYLPARSRSLLTLTALERALESLSAAEGRKAMILVSDGFIKDNSVDEYKDVIEASRRSNVAIYFLNTRGLQGLGNVYGAEFNFPIAERDMGAALADVTLEAAGSEYLADDTGGFIIQNTNDLEGGIQRIARESLSYYLLGYTPTNTTRDGAYRRIEVKVRGKGLNVRARKGYYALRDGETAPEGEAGTPDADMQRALDSPYFSDQIPMRMTAYVRDEVLLEQARTLVATEIDVSELAFQEQEEGGGRVATLHLLLVVAHRDSGEVHREDNEVEIALRPGEEGQPDRAWYALTREFMLAPGWHQAKAVVRDGHDRKLGTVAHEFEVPDLGEWRVSTPVLSDRLQSRSEDASPAPAVLARRRFPAGGALFCQFDVYGATKGLVTGMPRVSAGYDLLRADGTAVRHGELTAIRPTSLGYVSRLWAMGLGDVEPGDYELVITVRDEIADQVKEIREPFTVTAAPDSAGGG